MKLLFLFFRILCFFFLIQSCKNLEIPELKKGDESNHNSEKTNFRNLNFDEQTQRLIFQKWEKAYQYLVDKFPLDYKPIEGDEKIVFHLAKDQFIPKNTNVLRIPLNFDEVINAIRQKKDYLIDIMIMSEILNNRHNYTRRLIEIKYKSRVNRLTNGRQKKANFIQASSSRVLDLYTLGIHYIIQRHYALDSEGLSLQRRIDISIQELIDSKSPQIMFDYYHNMKLNFLSSEKDINSIECLITSFLHYNHLVNNLRIKTNDSQASYCKHNEDLFNELIEEKNKVLANFSNYSEHLKTSENSFSEVNQKDFISGVINHLQPFNPMVNHICKFWNVKKVDYQVDVFQLYKTLAFFSFTTNSITIGAPLNELTPNFIFSHEVAHHLQYILKFTDFIQNDYFPKHNKMGAELEADFLAGFYLSHKDGLNLPDDKLEQIRKEIFEEYGDQICDFELSPDPHGVGYQRQYAFILGCYLAHNNHVKKPKILHDTFKKFYFKSDLFRKKIPFDKIVFPRKN